MRKKNLEWQISDDLILYPQALQLMEQRVAEIINAEKPELIWLCEHHSVYTAGISAKDSDLLGENLPVYKTNRGGKYTYHGPGIKIIYVMLDLKKVFAPEKPDVARFVKMLENWIIAILARFNVIGEIRPGRVGVWVRAADGSEKKIAAIGIKLKKWVSYHGIAININPDLAAFNQIIPCGISEFGVTSLADLGKKISAAELNEIIRSEFYKIFNNY